MAYISGWGGQFELSFFDLKPCALACSFANNKPYVFKNFIFTPHNPSKRAVHPLIPVFIAACITGFMQELVLLYKNDETHNKVVANLT